MLLKKHGTTRTLEDDFCAICPFIKALLTAPLHLLDPDQVVQAANMLLRLGARRYQQFHNLLDPAQVVQAANILLALGARLH
eukprot:g7629.t1